MEHVVGPCDRLALLSVGFVDLSVFREAEGVFLRAFVSALAIYKKNTCHKGRHSHTQITTAVCSLPGSIYVH